MYLLEEDVKKMLACSVHVGDTHLDPGMERYVTGRNEVGAHIIDIRKTWEKLCLAARMIVAHELMTDVTVIGLSRGGGQGKNVPVAQRAVLKFAKYIGCNSIAGRFTPGTFTNQSQTNYQEPHLLIISDPLKDYQPILESSYVNIPVIALANTNANLRNVDVVIPCNTEGKFSVALIYWMLAREVLRLQGAITRKQEWEVMVDMFVYRAPDEIEAEQAEAAGAEDWAEGAEQDWNGRSEDWAAPSAVANEETEWAGESGTWGDAASDAASTPAPVAEAAPANWDGDDDGWA
jgi:small subunit ribosomal protein SAe